MGSLTIDLPDQRTQTQFNLERWEEVLADTGLQKIEGRIETDRHGKIIMNPPPATNHSSFQGEIYHLLRGLMRSGRVYPECPISTADGVRAADVAWASAECLRKLGNYSCFPVAPEICVEVISPSNRKQEITEKMALYFDAGAKEVWLCSPEGNMTYFINGGEAVTASLLCPEFPHRVTIGG